MMDKETQMSIENAVLNHEKDCMSKIEQIIIRTINAEIGKKTIMIITALIIQSLITIGAVLLKK